MGTAAHLHCKCFCLAAGPHVTVVLQRVLSGCRLVTVCCSDGTSGGPATVDSFLSQFPVPGGTAQRLTEPVFSRPRPACGRGKGEPGRPLCSWFIAKAICASRTRVGKGRLPSERDRRSRERQGVVQTQAAFPTLSCLIQFASKFHHFPTDDTDALLSPPPQGVPVCKSVSAPALPAFFVWFA